ncbi:MAG: N-acetylmuramoyl-L-alanine amidase [Actinomycetota bacterium]|nr:N-acetylmuramoyl-L-alanine amidase [Actinomycetota bacterium]
MRERSGTRTEHAHRRIPAYLTAATLLTGAGLAAPPSSAAPARPGPGGQAATPVPVSAAARPAVDGAVPGSDTDVDEIDLARGDDQPGPDEPEQPVVASLRGRAERDYGLVGVTWRHGTAPDDVRVQVRTEDERGWSAWQEVHFHPGEGPAPDEEDGAVRDGTEPLWVGDGDGVDARILSASGTAPADPRLTLVDPGAYPAPAATASGTGSAVAASPAVLIGRAHATSATTVSASAPKIVSRRGWGADPDLKERCDAPRRARTVQMAFVHHTAGSNDYSRAQSPAIVRSVYAYHTQGNGWCDIGYNFLVDRFGTVYEGRAGGVNTPVRGAHAGDYNLKTVGVSLMGNFERARPTRAMKRGLTRLLAWKLSSYYRYPRTKARIAGSTFEKISGHRDAMSTACPGRYAYAFLPALRRRVARAAGPIETPISRKWSALRRSGTDLGQPFRGETDSANTGRKTQFNRGWVFWNDRPGAHPVRGRIYHRYRAWGQARGHLGYPRTDVWRIRGHRGSGQSFQRGRIYRTPRNGAVAVWGRIDRRYEGTGLARGRLGVPVRNQYRIRRGWAAGFQHGRITWNTTTGRTTVKYY